MDKVVLIPFALTCFYVSSTQPLLIPKTQTQPSSQLSLQSIRPGDIHTHFWLVCITNHL